MSISNSHRDKEPIVIVGGGMAAHRLCTSLSNSGYNTANLEIYSGEEILPYDRANLSKCFKSENSTPTPLNQNEWYKQNKIKIHLQSKVSSIDPNQKLLIFEGGLRKIYSKLILALGSEPSTQSFSEAPLENVFTYRTWADLRRIRTACKLAEEVSIIGGGLLGLEAAGAIHSKSRNVTVFEMANTPLCRNLNEEAGFALLKSLESSGIRVVLKSQLKSIHQAEGYLNLVFNNKKKFRANVVVLATGHRPADQLAKSSGIEVSPNGGILVDEHLQTSQKDIFAIGDCISLKHRSFGFVQPAYHQANILASNLCGSTEKYEPKGKRITLNLSGVDISIYGENLGDAEHLTYKNGSTFRSLVVRRGILIGSTIIGNWTNSTALRFAVDENVKIPNRQKKVFNTTGELNLLDDFGEAATWSNDSIICNCCHIDCGTVRKEIKKGGDNLQKIKHSSGAGSKCGSCRLQLLGLIHAGLGNNVKLENSIFASGKIFKYLAVCSLILSVLYWLPWQISAPYTVDSLKFEFSKLWTDSVIKQITGFTVAGISFFSLLYSLRKRLGWFRIGKLGIWKTFHVLSGFLAIIVLFFHTGLSWGYNLNFLLATNFLTLNTLGALAAVNYSAKLDSSSFAQNRIRYWLIRSHILFFWPYPILLFIHLYSVYQY